jgi:hypothetical protein
MLVDGTKCSIMNNRRLDEMLWIREVVQSDLAQ